MHKISELRRKQEIASMGMLTFMEGHDACDHIYENNETMWIRARQFSYASEAIIQPTIFSIGIITNVLSLVVLSGVRMNEIFRSCLISLAISDLCCTVVGLCQILVEVVFYCGNVPEGYFQYPVIANNTLYMAYLMFISTSGSIVVFIAFIRNMMYLKPLRARAFFTPSITRVACGIIVFITLLLYLPTCLQVMWLACYKETPENSEYCRKQNESIPNLDSIANGYLYFNVALYGPVMLLLYLANYICIRVSLTRSKREVNKMTVNGKDGDRSNVINRITKMLSLILILDVVCTFPSVMQSIGLLFKPKEHVFEKEHLFFELIDAVAEIFLALRPTYNFWLYVFQRPEFRKRLTYIVQSMLKPCCKQECCPCPEYFENIKMMSSGDGNGSRKPSHDNINVTSMTKAGPIMIG